MGEHPFQSPLLRALMKTTVRWVLQNAPVFEHLIKPNANQKDFHLPNAPNNPAKLLFANGSKNKLTKIMAKCRQEKITFFGALAASIFLSYIVTSDSMDDEAFKLTVHLSLNMRERLFKTMDAQTVGCSITTTDMNAPVLNIAEQRFWDLARRLKHESMHALDSFAALATPMILLDQHYNRQSDPTLHEEFPFKYSHVADVNISSVGRYPYPRSHSFTSGLMMLESL